MVKLFLSLMTWLTARDTGCDVLLHPVIYSMDERQRGDLPLGAPRACG